MENSTNENILMRNVNIKMKILINGLFPLENYKIDNFLFKVCQYNEKIIDEKDEDYLFYSSSYLLFSSYAVQEKEGVFYNVFENDEYISIAVSDDIYCDKEKLSHEILSKLLTLFICLRED